MTYNVQGSSEQLQKLSEMTGVTVADRWTKVDWNFDVEDDCVDDFVEECENMGVEFQVV